MENTKFTSKQRLICILCFCAYFFAYLTRKNISVVLSDIQQELNLLNGEESIIGSAFFVVYAAGQIISGWLGDRISPKYMISVGLVMSSVINITISFMNSLPAIAVLWGINGIFQSMLWAPIMKTIVIHFSGKRLQKMTFLMSLTLVFGSAISWSASTLIKTFISWRAVFIIPAAASILFTAVWLFSYPKKKDASGKDEGYELKPDTKGMFTTKGIALVILIIAIMAVLHGIIKDSIDLWLPTMLASTGSFSLSSTLGILIVVPVINFCGIMLMKTLMAKSKSGTYMPLLILFAVSFIGAVVTAVVSGISAIVLVIMTIAISGCMMAINPVLTAYVPLDFTRWNCVATIAGFIDCMIYVGSALSSPLTRMLAHGDDWSGVTVMWAVVLCAGLAVSFTALKVSQKFLKHEENS